MRISAIGAVLTPGRNPWALHFLVSVCVLHGGSTAQATPQSQRDLRPALVRYSTQHPDDRLEFGQLFVKSQSAEIRWLVSGEGGPVTTDLGLPSFQVGGLSTVEPGHRYLISGVVDGATGILARLRLDRSSTPRAVRIDEIVRWPGVDLVSVAWNRSDARLYVLDFVGQRILMAPWDGADSTPLPAVTSFVVIADRRTMPDLQNAHEHRLTAGAEQPPRIGVEVRWASSPVTYPWLHDTFGAWQLELRGLIEDQPDAFDRYLVQDPSHAGIDRLRVTGPVVGFFQLVHERFASVVGWGSVTTANEWVDVVPTTALVPGDRYIVTSPFAPHSRILHPLVRHGQPRTEAGTMQFGRGLLRPEACAIGNDEFAISCPILAPTPLAQRETLQVSVWMALRGAAGDPVTTIGARPVLEPSSFATFPVSIEPGARATPVGVPMPIPLERSMVGAVLLFQFVGTRQNDDMLLSDVFGTSIFAAPVSTVRIVRIGDLRRPSLRALEPVSADRAPSGNPFTEHSLRSRLLRWLESRK